MNTKNFKLFLLTFSMLLLAACNTSEPVVEDPVTDPEDESLEMQDDTTLDDTEDPVPESKLSSDATEISYTGTAKFIQETVETPCADYAMDSEICTADPNGVHKIVMYYVQLPKAEVNAELISYLDKQNEYSVKKETDNYSINLGCKGDNKIEGDEYGTYNNELINEAFESGGMYNVDFTLYTPEGSDAQCGSLIKEFKQIKK